MPSRSPALQLYDLRSPEETPRAIAFHPTRPVLFCGFASGAVCSFSLEAAGVLVRHRWVPGGLQPHRHPWWKLTWCGGGQLGRVGDGPPLPSGDSSRPGCERSGQWVPVCYRRHQGAVTGLAASPDGSFLFSSCSRGTLAQYHCSTTRCRVLRVTGQAPRAPPGPPAVSLSGPRGVGLARYPELRGEGGLGLLGPQVSAGP